MADRVLTSRTRASAHNRDVILLTLGGLVFVVMALTACGSSQDIASKSPAAILAASRTAARDASAVHVTSQTFGRLPITKATAKTKAQPITALDLHLTSDGGRARLRLLGTETEVVRTGSTVYLKASPGFYKRLAQRTGMHLTAGTWLKAPAKAAEPAEFAALTEPGGELTLLLGNPTLSLTKGPLTTINKQKAIELKTKGKLYTGAIYIAATGTPYPLMIVKHGQENATTTFSGWNDPETLKPPANAVAIKQLQRPRGR